MYLYRPGRGSCGRGADSRRPGMWVPCAAVLARSMGRVQAWVIANQMYREAASSPYPAEGVVIVSGSEDGLVPDGVVAVAVME